MAETRRRVTRACDSCARKRRKCDAEQPVCGQCAAAGKDQECSYSKPVKRRGPQAGYSKLASQASLQLRHLQVFLGTLVRLQPQLAAILPAILNQIDQGAALTEEDALANWQNSVLAPWLDAKLPQEEDEEEGRARKRARNTLEQPEASTSTQSNFYMDHQLLQSPQHYELPINMSNPSLDPQLMNQAIGSSFSPAQPSPSSMSSFQPPPLWQQQLAPADSSLFAPQFSPVSQMPETETPIFLPITTMANGSTSNEHILSQSQTYRPQQVEVEPIASLQDLRLPPEHLIISLLDVYFNDSFHSFLPIIDKQRLLTWCMEADLSARLVTTDGIRSELLFAIFALALPHVSDNNIKNHLTVSQTLARATAAINISLKAPTLSTVQALVLTAFAHLNEGHLSLASSKSGLATSVAFSLGLNSAGSAFYTGDDRIHALRTFWGLYILDTLVSLRLGKVPAIRPSQFNVPLPAKSGPEEVEIWRPSHLQDSLQGSAPVSRSNVLSVFVEMINLCRLASDMCMRLNAPTKIFLPNDGVLEISSIVQQLVSWGDSLSNHLRLLNGIEAPAHKIELSLFHMVLLNLARRPTDYHHHPASDAFGNNLQASLDLISSRSFHRSRPALLEYCLLTIASTCHSAAPMLGKDASSDVQPCIRSLQQLGVFYPAVESSIATLQGLPNLSTFSMQRTMPTPQSSTMSDGHSTTSSEYTGFLPPIMQNNNVAPRPDWMKDVSVNDVGMGALDLNAIGAFDITNWSTGDEVLNWLGVRGETRPSTPTNKEESTPAQYPPQNFGLDSLWV